MRVSVIFETDAILPPEAPPAWELPYFNLVVSGKTTLSPLEMLKNLKKIEQKLGRDLQALRWAPRVIDLDILAWDDLIFSSDELTIPHVELMNRPFFIGLMASLNSDWRYPISGFSYSHLTLREILYRHVVFNPVERKCFMPFPLMVGIINVTPDSFSDGGNYVDPEKAGQKMKELIDQGAAVIDFGARSTRPGAVSISSEEEWMRLRPVLDLFMSSSERPQLSIDSCDPKVLELAIERYPVDFVNDVKGGEDENFLRRIAETDCKLIINHSLTIPSDRNIVIPFEKNPILYLYEWAERKIQKLNLLGISHDRIIFDPGIGFGKSPFQSLSLLREIDVLKKNGL
jgi:2-amino-4-hydroxy-6-hydroxymethyldihydropteridine diphosphokinase/dihydropteroate synthase